MVYFIKNYSLGARLAIVSRDERFCDVGMNAAERIVIEKNKITYLSDQASMGIDEVTWFHLKDLHEGDILSINDRGVCYRMFDVTEEDATIFMGGKCNSNCVMCPSSDHERQEDYSGQREELLKYIDMLPQNLSHYVMTGGEPTMQPTVFLEVMEKLAIKFPETSALLLTNGRSFSSRQFLDQLIQKCPPYLVAAIPLHGAEGVTHDAITRAPGSFYQTLQGIGNLLDNGIAIEIRIVVTKMNCDSLEAIARLICRHFPNVMCVNFISLEVRGNCAKNKEIVYISPRDSFRKSRPAIDYLVKNGIDVGLYNYPLCCVERGYWFLCKRSISPEKVRYDEVCQDCEAKKYCGGIFVSTLKTTHPDVAPIIFK